MEVTMDQSKTCWIDPCAAQALAKWKALFAEQVMIHAKELAKKENSPGAITLDHYRESVSMAAQFLVNAVKDSDSSNGRQEAA
jgi:hypothetical protein